jgi:hypothetical protein
MGSLITSQSVMMVIRDMKTRMILEQSLLRIASRIKKPRQNSTIESSTEAVSVDQSGKDTLQSQCGKVILYLVLCAQGVNGLDISGKDKDDAQYQPAQVCYYGLCSFRHSSSFHTWSALPFFNLIAPNTA